MSHTHSDIRSKSPPLSPQANPVRLTQTVQKGGCAAKLAASELRTVLARVNFPPQIEGVEVGSGTFDDAAIYRLPGGERLVQTLDFFTPVVDTPRVFGRIAAANALSDVYAMGGAPLTAMAILAFPTSNLPIEVAVDVLQGASDALREARASLVGGHTIDDDTLKFGLSVTGTVTEGRLWTNASAKPGDLLILTKPLGTGTLTAGLKRSVYSESDIQVALESMAQLNDAPSLLAGVGHVSDLTGAVHAATDITGYGLLGHALNMALASQVSLALDADALPALPGSLASLQDGLLTKAHRTNREYVQAHADLSDADELSQLLALDPQTSGGLLLSVEASQAGTVLQRLKGRFKESKIIGRVSSIEALKRHVILKPS